MLISSECVSSYQMQYYRHFNAVHNLLFLALFACWCETHIPRKVPKTKDFYEFTRCRQHTVSTCVDFILHSFLSRPSYPTVFYKYVLQTKVPKIFLMLLPERTKLLHCSRLLLLKQFLQNPLQEDRLY